MADKLIGEVTHYYNKIGVAVIRIDNGKLAVGEQIKFKHGDKEFQQMVASLEIDRQPVGKIDKGEEAGLKVDEPVKEGWKVLKVSE